MPDCVPSPAEPDTWADDACSAVADVLKALADGGRLRLFVAIATRPQPVCVCDLPDVGLSQPTVSHHLKRLRAAGLVDAQRRGSWVHYGATDSGRRALAALEGLRSASGEQAAGR